VWQGRFKAFPFKRMWKPGAHEMFFGHAGG
jgi:hypothetical protein